MSEETKAPVEKQPVKKGNKDKSVEAGMTPERAKELGLDPFPYGG